RFEDGQRLAELHGAALEFAENPEDLVGGPLLYLCGHELGRVAAKPLSQAQRGPPRYPNRQRGELERPSHRLARQVCHGDIVAGRWESPYHWHWQFGCGCHDRRRIRRSRRLKSTLPSTVAGTSPSRCASACPAA